MDIYKTNNGIISKLEKIEIDSWINLINPGEEELNNISKKYSLDIDDLKAALDTEESARIEVEDNYTLVLIDIPVTEERLEKKEFTTIPLGVIFNDEVIITVCTENTSILNSFINKRVKGFSTKKRVRFLYQILYKISIEYQNDLRLIDKKRIQIEDNITDITEDSELIELHEMESNLVYFATSLRANGLILDKLTRYTKIKQYPEDRELLEDVIIENKQAIEMTSIYRDIINGTRELTSTIINNKLNNTMKYLAAVTIVMSIPTIISGIYGMNLNASGMPLSSSPFGFMIICGITMLISGLALLVLKKKKML